MTRNPKKYLHGPNPAISMNATYYKGQRSVYGRDTNPTWEHLEEEIGRLEGGLCTVFASGMGAIASMIVGISKSQRLFLASDSYNGTRRLSELLVKVGRLDLTYATPNDIRLKTFLNDARPGDIFFFESPSNPELNVYDISEIAAACKDLGMLVAIDSTLATPVLQRPLSLGVDVVIHSLTKAISGHSDVLGGAVVVADGDLDADFKLRRSLFGAIPSAQDAFLILRGLKTLEIRMERAVANASRAFSVLYDRIGSSELRYPYHPDSDTLEVAKSQMKSGGSVLSVIFEGAAQADAFVDSLSLFHRATSLGGVESLAERRAFHRGEDSTHPGLVRLSFGVEPWEELKDDLLSALERVGL